MNPMPLRKNGETSRDHRHAMRTSDAVPRDHLFVLIECNRPLAGAARCDLTNVDEIIIGRGETRSVRREDVAGARRLLVTIPDRLVSSVHARMTRRAGRWLIEDLHSTNGVLVNGSRLGRAELEDRAIVECGRTLLCVAYRLLTPPDAAADVDFSRGESATDFATVVPSLACEFAAIQRAAASEIPVLLLAETGAGKEVAARAVHHLSGRKGAFVAVNCGALTSSLCEAQLFGHVRGAFSGAQRDEQGLVRAAERGTLFLDEVGELPAASQPALLRVLQEKEVTPIGSSRSIATEFRLISATNRSLPEVATQGAFRHDLLARLDGFTFTLPPLRERVFDLSLFIPRILERVADPRRATLRFAPEAARAFYRYSWPCNIREFEQCLHRALTLAPDDVIGPEHIRLGILADSSRAALSPPSPTSLRDRPEQLVALLRSHGGNIAAVARETGKASIQVRRWMKKLGIDPNDYRT
jgi:DNA-binding NtrC family response regulator